MAVEHHEIAGYGMILPTVDPSVGDGYIGHMQPAVSRFDLAVGLHTQPRIAERHREQAASPQQFAVRLRRQGETNLRH